MGEYGAVLLYLFCLLFCNLIQKVSKMNLVRVLYEMCLRKNPFLEFQWDVIVLIFICYFYTLIDI